MRLSPPLGSGAGVTITFSPSQGKQPAHGARRVGLVMVLSSTALLLFSAAALGVRIGPSVTQMLSAQAYALPMDATMSLHPGTWVVFEQTGSQSQTGPVTVTSNRAPRVTADRVTVTDAGGTPVPTARITSSQTIDQGGLVYTGAVTFVAPADGQYRVAVSGAGGQVIVAEDLGDLFGASAIWFVLIAVGFLGLLAGVVAILVGRRRFPQNVRPSPRRGPVTASAGWYSDPSRPGQFLWWDGTHWRAPRPPGASPQDSDTHPAGPRI